MDRADELVTGIREALHDAAEPGIALGQQAYMKSVMPFVGVRVPAVRRLTREQVRGEQNPAVLLETAKRLWDEAGFREERYAALAVLGVRPLRADRALLPVIEHVVRTGQWWDFTDEVVHRVTDLLTAHTPEMSFVIRTWSADDDLWMRRLAIIAQLGRRDALDRGLLAEVIIPNLGDPEFFIRKAIGWALRDAARTDPDWVRSFVAAYPLSPLSAREALRRL
ncbi:DNA alkylation repair protein [Microbacterium memoriense]|uniref:DNA alkylation repair protein n=1 Tax=Microbacterium memoriense TaxID=2978350 RepID=A0ABT2P7X5_9MICO|nr:DNA alkylation repair protein [Microbacterium memoriense]MCT9000798.1 DNA alkylation repair protein [Microbacterium memoriense]